MPTPEVTRFWIAQTWPAVSWRNIHCFLKGKSLISMQFATHSAQVLARSAQKRMMGVHSANAQ